MRKAKQYINKITEFCALFNNVHGDIIEIGTYDGDDSEIICSYLQKNKSDKKYIGIDTFEGYIEEDLVGANDRSFTNHKSKRWNTSIDALHQRLSRFNNYEIHKGDSKVVIPKLINDENIMSLSIIYIDCNLYTPSIQAMRDLYPLLSNNGVIAIDEHLVGGETKAIKEFSKEMKIDLEYFSDIRHSYYMVKK